LLRRRIADRFRAIANLIDPPRPYAVAQLHTRIMVDGRLIAPPTISNVTVKAPR
jgi:hypothetical protein